MNLQGKIKSIDAIVLRGANNFKTRKIMLDRTTTYEGQERVNFTEISLLGDNADLPEKQDLQVGDYIKCDCNPEGRFFMHEEKEKFAQEVKAWKIEVLNKAAATSTTSQPSTPSKEGDMP